MKVVIAIPTIEARGDAWAGAGTEWIRHTCQPINVIPSWRPGSWSAGLNEVWEQHPDADVFVCGSDDMLPANDFWLPPALAHLEKNECPVPTVFDPRMTTHGGTQDTYWDGPPTEGAPARMTNFPILKGEWLDKVFPMPEELHYYSDNEIGERLKKAGIPLVTCLDIQITHTWDERGRGAGHGSEEARMQHDRQIYRAMKR